MKISRSMLAVVVCSCVATVALADGWQGKGQGKGRASVDAVNDSDEVTESTQADETVLDNAEATHLTFMREEEKLARDVYTVLGSMYPDATIFGNIDDSEQRHTDAVRDKLLQYGNEDPSTNDNIGMYTGEDYGWYFAEKFDLLVERGSISELDALYVGAFIEELDMIDLMQCPKVIVDTDNGIDDTQSCGRIYTDKEDLVRLYDTLLDGSTNHLRAYVGKIEAVIGPGNYQAQVLGQDEVNTLLGR